MGLGGERANRGDGRRGRGSASERGGDRGVRGDGSRVGDDSSTDMGCRGGCRVVRDASTGAARGCLLQSERRRGGGNGGVAARRWTSRAPSGNPTRAGMILERRRHISVVYRRSWSSTAATGITRARWRRGSRARWLWRLSRRLNRDRRASAKISKLTAWTTPTSKRSPRRSSRATRRTRWRASG